MYSGGAGGGHMVDDDDDDADLTPAQHKVTANVKIASN